MKHLKVPTTATLLLSALTWASPGSAETEPTETEPAETEPTVTELPGAKPLMVEGTSVAEQALTTKGVPTEKPPSELTRPVTGAPSAQTLTVELLAAMGCQLPILAFEPGSARVTETVRINLDLVAACMAEHSELKLWVFGQAGDSATATPDWVLGFERANAVTDYLVSKGVYRGRLVPASAAPTATSQPGRVTFDVAKQPRLERALEANS